jgi:hypothetical protein
MSSYACGDLNVERHVPTYSKKRTSLLPEA